MITCGRNARTISTTSLRIESFGQCSYVSSSVFENPKSNARVKYWRPPSMPARGEQLLGADHAEHRPELVADEILSAVAAGERQIRRLDVPRLGEIRDELRVFVVGVRADHQHARRRAEALDQPRPTQRRRDS